MRRNLQYVSFTTAFLYGQEGIMIVKTEVAEKIEHGGGKESLSWGKRVAAVGAPWKVQSGLPLPWNMEREVWNVNSKEQRKYTSNGTMGWSIRWAGRIPLGLPENMQFFNYLTIKKLFNPTLSPGSSYQIFWLWLVSSFFFFFLQLDET